MRIATRLVLISVIAVTAVMTTYGLISLDQRAALIGGAFVRETDAVASTIQAVMDNALRDGRMSDIHRVLGRLSSDPVTFATGIVAPDGRAMAGGPPSALACVMNAYTEVSSVGRASRGWVECDGRIRWVALPVRPPAAAMILARRTTVVQRDTEASRWRIGVTTVALALVAALGIIVVLRRTVSKPLSELMRGVRTLGGPAKAARVRVAPSSGEVGELAGAFNEMVERLDGKRRSLMRETEERIALERRLRGAEKFAAIGRLTSGLAHELGSPLNVIAVRAEAIAEDPAAPADARRQANHILVEIERMSGLVRGLTHIARKHPIARKPADMAEVVRGAVAAVRDEADQARIRIQVDVPAQPVTVSGDPVLLRHALSNLVSNAVQALAEKTTADRKLRISVAVEAGAARIHVEDNGPGIEPKFFSRVMEPFFTTREIGDGMGLGLAIALGIIEEHDGTLELESAEADGAHDIESAEDDGARGLEPAEDDGARGVKPGQYGGVCAVVRLPLAAPVAAGGE